MTSPSPAARSYTAATRSVSRAVGQPQAHGIAHPQLPLVAATPLTATAAADSGSPPRGRPDRAPRRSAPVEARGGPGLSSRALRRARTPPSGRGGRRRGHPEAASAVAVPSGSGAPPRPATTCPAGPRAAVVLLHLLLGADLRDRQLPTSIAISTTGGPAPRSASGWRRGPCWRACRHRAPAAARPGGGRDPRRTRPSIAEPRASSSPRGSRTPAPLAGEDDRHRDAAAERAGRPTSAGRQAGRARPPTSRSASAGRYAAGPARAATTASWATTTPRPRAATSGIQDVPGSKPAGTVPWSSSTSDQRGRERTAGQQPEAAGDHRDEERLAGDQPPDLAGVAPSARSTADSRRRWAIARRTSPRPRTARHAGDPAHRAEDRDHRLTLLAAGVARVGLVQRARSSTSTATEPCVARRAQRGGGRPPVGDDADGVECPAVPDNAVAVGPARNIAA